MPKKIILTCLLIVVVLVSFTTVVIADDLIDLQNRKNELNNQITEANEQVENIQIELTDTLKQKNWNVSGPSRWIKWKTRNITKSNKNRRGKINKFRKQLQNTKKNISKQNSSTIRSWRCTVFRCFIKFKHSVRVYI